ncbi:hypothetical protein KVR01_002317 [Diaporthe batatas]|uniref:uncharacterized protein n=1 Tax=Diaporthe batatas TaxID=748121 RepID=UPI001D039E2F|nr:uncharacterized protein KVR01_002317 [Diaporthe batatas]KAG8166628.1 hypothetical protein KVR01_002317 [Diaporthe batatas]
MAFFEASRSRERNSGERFQPTSYSETLSELVDQFHNFDETDVYDDYMNRAVENKTTNFVIRISLHGAHIATSLRDQDIAALLDLKSNDGLGSIAVTWIHFWTVEACYNAIRKVSEHYNFLEELERAIFARDDLTNEFLGALFARDDLDKESLRKMGFPAEVDENGNFMVKLLQPRNKHTAIYHSSNYLCVGAYWLYKGPSESHSTGSFHGTSDNLSLPEYTNYSRQPKSWAWYIVTDDYTVISIQEASVDKQVPENITRDRMTDLKLQHLRNMRQHIQATLGQLSQVGATRPNSHYPSPLNIRDLERDRTPILGKTGTSNAKDYWAADVAATIFHCLINNYSVGSSILLESNRIRDLIFSGVLSAKDKPRRFWDHSDLTRMKQTQQQVLEDLKLLFRAHERLLKVIINLEFGTPDLECLEGYPIVLNDRWDLEVLSPCSGPMPRGVKLPQKIYYRFVRLYDDMHWPKFALESHPIGSHGPFLDEIDRLLEDFSELSVIMFGMKAIKDSRQIHTAARSVSMLSKLWILFMPLFTVTAIFSVKIPDVADHPKVYPIALGVVGALSVLFLFVNGVMGRI